MSAAVVWPGVVKQADVAELIYIENQSSLAERAELHRLLFDGRDRLIDSAGQVFQLVISTGKVISLEPVGPSIELEEMIAMVRAHAVCSESCCVAKFTASSFAEAVQTVGALQDD